MQFIILMRALATMLVMNSHCDILMPISALATGGSIGDSFFFAVSGFTLYKSVGTGFGEYAKRRASRLYPSIIFVTLLIIASAPSYAVQVGICDLHNLSFWGMLRTFIYPTCYPFLTALIAYYIIYYIILHVKESFKDRSLEITFFVVIILYALYYIFSLDKTKWSIEEFPIKYLYWFAAFLVGGVFVLDMKFFYDGVRIGERLSVLCQYYYFCYFIL